MKYTREDRLMKQYFFLICMILSLLFLLTACGDVSVESTEPPTTTEGEHIHELQDVSGEHASICTLCGEKLLRPEAHTFIREHCDDYGECSICGETFAPEAHDWSPEEVREDCWSSTITITCYKCGLENWTHADYAWPDHIWKEETEDGKTTYSCTRCKKSYVMVGEIGSFSYAEVLEIYKIGEPGVKQENFGLYKHDGITCAIDAVTMAVYSVTVQYDTVAVAYDETTGVWCVDFYMWGVDGGNQAVYVNPNEEICYIVYGE